MAARTAEPVARRPWLWIAALSAALFLLLAARLDFLCDDAYISFRYARNLARGDGLVFNPLREVPVEGYSNFLWVLYLALCARLGLPIPEMSKLGSVLSGLALIALGVHFVRTRLRLSVSCGLFSGLFLASLPPIALWATGGLAALPMTLAVFAGYVALFGREGEPRGLLAGACLTAAAWIRADGMVWDAMLLGSAVLVWLVGGRSRALRRALLQAAGLVALGVGLHFAWRLQYYGDWLPNTARVKAGFSWSRLGRGLDYVASCFLSLPSLPLALLLSLARPRRESAALWLPGLGVLAGTLGYAVWVGGDFMPFGRFLLPIMPFGMLAFACAFGRLERRARGAASGFGLVLVGLSVLACFDVNLVPRSVLERFHFRRDRSFQTELERRAEMDRNARKWVWLGRALNEHTRAEESIILGGIGAAGFYSELFIFDLYGLVTPEVLERGEVRQNASPGHDRRVQEPTFFEDEPTYLRAILGYTGAGEPPWWADRMPANWETHPFREKVRELRFPLPEAEGFPPDCELILFRFLWADE